MNGTGLQRDYDVWHSRFAAKEDDPLAYPWYAAALPYVMEHSGGKLLEIGCGRGDFAILLAEKRRDLAIAGVDFSEQAIAVAKERALRHGIDVAFATGDAQRLAFPDNHFDFVLSCECMEHVPRPERMAGELARVLKPGGKFCLTTENYLNGMLVAWLQTWITGRPFDSGSGVQPIENFFVFWRVASTLEKAGLVIDQTESCHVQWVLLPRVNPRRLCTDHFKSAWLRRLMKPFGRHYLFFGHKPVL